VGESNLITAFKNKHITNIKEVYNKSNNRRFIYIKFLKNCGGNMKEQEITLELFESLRDKGIKTYAETFDYIIKNYDEVLNLK